MQSLDGRLVHSASDLNGFTECLHLTALGRRVALGEIAKPQRSDPTADLLARKGDEHERAHLERLRREFGDHLVAFEARPVPTIAGYEAAEAESIAAMAAGADVIYQATFFDGTFLGRADFLRKVARPSPRFGAWSYEAVDTKLALSPKPYFLVQLCNYSEHLARIQRVAPFEASIVLGSGFERRFRLDDFAAYYRRLKASYLEAVATRADAYPLQCAHCDFCAWHDVCARKRDVDDHLSIVANIRRDQIVKLEDAGIATVAALAGATDEARPVQLNAQTFSVLRNQAGEQHRWRAARDATGYAPHTYRFRNDGPETDEEAKTHGFARLPEPAAGDVFFDMEGDPMYRPGRALEYLFGVYLSDENEYRPFWGTDPAMERRAFEAFVDFVVERRTRYPKLHVYHYAPYETSALKRLMGRFASREEDIDAMLRAGTFVDLYPIVRQSVFISQPSYSIKKVEALYGFKRTTKTKGGDDSIVMFESWLEDGNPATLDDIRAYNDDDCRSTYELREWLVSLRARRNAERDVPLAWRAALLDAIERDADGEPKTKAVDETKRSEREAHKADVQRLSARLLAGVDDPVSLDDLRERTEHERVRWLLGNLLQYHQRAQKPEWWEYFHRIESTAELIDEDRKALGGLRPLADFEPYKTDKSLTYAYTFPEQEHDFAVRDKAVDPASQKSVGPIVRLDETDRVVHVKIGKTVDPARLRTLIPEKPLDDNKKRARIEAIARAYEGGTLERDHPATFAMLAGRRPRLADRPADAPIQPEHATKEALSQIVAALERSHLVVQGPPGSGKSTKGAHAIVDLIVAGKRVALAAQSHKALHGLLDKIETTAADRCVALNGCHKSSASNFESPFVSKRDVPYVGDAPTTAGYVGCDLVSATTYAWADSEQSGAFDVVVIDEAGQISLADALVTSLVAKNVVLLGDPQQLPQVDQGTHPLGSDRSILEHLLDGHDTIASDRGVFLDTSYRMHPAIDRFVSDAFYDGRLKADAPNARNRIVLDGVAHAGPRFIAVDHDGHKHRSPEEAERIVDEIETLLARGRVTIRDHVERALEPCDILVVAPYNRQRREIAETLRARGIAGVEVGTVDKFQGQEAPVVFFSLTTSRAELAPRGLDFLLSPNRLNVAVSRAQALSVVVASPYLLASRATSIEQMQLTNLLCAYAEAAAESASRR